MTQRLTPEREREIREETCVLMQCPECELTKELLAEIDATRADLIQLLAASIDLKEDRDRLAERVRSLRESLRDVFGLIDTHFLVRNIDNDHDPDWAIKQLEPMTKLNSAYKVLIAEDEKEIRKTLEREMNFDEV